MSQIFRDHDLLENLAVEAGSDFICVGRNVVALQNQQGRDGQI